MSCSASCGQRPHSLYTSPGSGKGDIRDSHSNLGTPPPFPWPSPVPSTFLRQRGHRLQNVWKQQNWMQQAYYGRGARELRVSPLSAKGEIQLRRRSCLYFPVSLKAREPGCGFWSRSWMEGTNGTGPEKPVACRIGAQLSAGGK